MVRRRAAKARARPPVLGDRGVLFADAAEQVAGPLMMAEPPEELEARSTSPAASKACAAAARSFSFFA